MKLLDWGFECNRNNDFCGNDKPEFVSDDNIEYAKIKK